MRRFLRKQSGQTHATRVLISLVLPAEDVPTNGKKFTRQFMVMRKRRKTEKRIPTQYHAEQQIASLIDIMERRQTQRLTTQRFVCQRSPMYGVERLAMIGFGTLLLNVFNCLSFFCSVPFRTETGCPFGYGCQQSLFNLRQHVWLLSSVCKLTQPMCSSSVGY